MLSELYGYEYTDTTTAVSYDVHTLRVCSSTTAIKVRTVPRAPRKAERIDTTARVQDAYTTGAACKTQ